MGTTERLSLEAANEHTLLACEHTHRYELAAALVADARVVDLACGVGYGSAMLRRAAREVLGVDIDVATVDLANATVGREPGISFVAADAGEWLQRCEPESLDVLVCFEGLEHVPDLDVVSRELVRLAAGGVRLVLSVPNSAAFEEDNEFHLTDFSYDSARSLFEQFDDLRLVLQYLVEGSVFIDPADPDREPGTTLRRPERAEPEYANHYIALVGFGDDDAVSAALTGRLQIEFSPVFNRHLRNVERSNVELWRTNARLGRSAFARFDSAAAAFARREHHEVVAARALSEELEARAGGLEERVHELELELAELGQELAETRAQLASAEAMAADRPRSRGRRG